MPPSLPRRKEPITRTQILLNNSQPDDSAAQISRSLSTSAPEAVISSIPVAFLPMNEFHEEVSRSKNSLSDSSNVSESSRLVISTSSATTSQNRIDRLLAILETGQTSQVRLNAGEQLAQIGTLRSETISPICQRLISLLLRPSTKPAASSSSGPSSWDVREAASAALGYFGPLLNTLSKVSDSSAIKTESDCDLAKITPPFHPFQSDWQLTLESHLSTFDIVAFIRGGERLLSSAGTEYDEEDYSAQSPLNARSNPELKKKRLATAREEVQRATGGVLGAAIPGTSALPMDWIDEEDVASPSPCSKPKQKGRVCKPVSFPSGPLPEPSSLMDAILQLSFEGLLHDRWTIRHGAALGLEALLMQRLPIDEKDGFAICCVAFRVLQLLTLESFADFVGERTQAPVREAAASLLATACTSLQFSFERSTSLINEALQMIGMQVVRMADQTLPWHARHAALLVIKALIVSSGGSPKPLQPLDVVQILTTCLTAPCEDDDIRLVATEILLWLLENDGSTLLKDTAEPVSAITCNLKERRFILESLSLSRLAASISQLMLERAHEEEDLSPITTVGMQLLAALLITETSKNQRAKDATKPSTAIDKVEPEAFIRDPSIVNVLTGDATALLIYSRHPLSSVRAAFLRTIRLMRMQVHPPSLLMEALFQSMLLEDDPELLGETAALWSEILPTIVCEEASSEQLMTAVLRMRTLLLHHPLAPFVRAAFPWASKSDLGFSPADISTLTASVVATSASMPRLINRWRAAVALGELLAAMPIITFADLTEQLFPLQPGHGAWRTMASAWVLMRCVRFSMEMRRDAAIMLWQLALLPLSTDEIVFQEEEADLVAAIERHLNQVTTVSPGSLNASIPGLLGRAAALISQDPQCFFQLQSLVDSLQSMHEQLRLQVWAILATLFLRFLLPIDNVAVPASLSSFALNPVLRPIVSWLRSEDGSIQSLQALAPIKGEVSAAFALLLHHLITADSHLATYSSASPEMLPKNTSPKLPSAQASKTLFAVAQPATAAFKALANMLLGIGSADIFLETFDGVHLDNQDQKEDATNDHERDMETCVSEVEPRLPAPFARAFLALSSILKPVNLELQWIRWLQDALFPPQIPLLRRLQLSWLIINAAGYNCTLEDGDNLTFHVASPLDSHLESGIKKSSPSIRLLSLQNDILLFKDPTEENDPAELEAKIHWSAWVLAATAGKPYHQSLSFNSSRQLDHMLLQEILTPGSPLSLVDVMSSTQLMSDSSTSILRIRGVLDAIIRIFSLENNGVASSYVNAILMYLPLLAPPLIPLLSHADVGIRLRSAHCFAIVIQGVALQVSPSKDTTTLQTANMKPLLEQMRTDAIHFCDQLFRPETVPLFDPQICYGPYQGDQPSNLKKGDTLGIEESEKDTDGIFSCASQAQQNAKSFAEFTLRPYQREGISWLAFLARAGLHGILCDDMGLGKTIQMLTVLAAGAAGIFSPREKQLPSLIVVPPSLLLHWKMECERLTGRYLQPMLYHGPDRRGLLATFRNWPQDHPGENSHINGPCRGLLVISTYDVVRVDPELLSEITWAWVVLDEGHAIRNFRSKVSVATKQLRALHRVILTGTPVQNNLTELWSLFDFIMPGFLGNTHAVFMRCYGRTVQAAAAASNATSKNARKAVVRRSAETLELLHRACNPFMLRRMKEDVLDDLPPKIIIDRFVELSQEQRKLYEFVLHRDREEGVHVFSTIRTLLQVCNAPALLKGADGTGPSEVTDAATSIPPKLVALGELLSESGITGSSPYAHRALLVFQSTRMLEIVEEQLLRRSFSEITWLRLDGSIPPARRGMVVENFNGDASIGLLLMTIGIGGEGLNLTGADIVIFVECDWNPTKDLQAMDRVHRLGQTRSVSVYRLLTRGTIEQRLLSLQQFKLSMVSSLITQQNAALSSMDTTKLLDIFLLAPE
ncbi:hypothetical protein DI09_43p130 [Mitosporidium daphniae]|uniref:Uncharacterized protein n=1 Tax=Mitosporidium daphniae TaxID=1485682 RepID=A0A098VQ29_9MICR|nr:uncharacterized protein DI09_43p130 [Mitosporidium daphniae]KGG51138.1 hypothetical protein DI09_43p130 [Mitosporidium daphniae]|eukprot:XP_013237565.1 uncharacterized protein DI09_43p130 [Mitosporidium daphniae]